MLQHDSCHPGDADLQISTTSRSELRRLTWTHDKEGSDNKSILSKGFVRTWPFVHTGGWIFRHLGRFPDWSVASRISCYDSSHDFSPIKHNITNAPMTMSMVFVSECAGKRGDMPSSARHHHPWQIVEIGFTVLACCSKIAH
eukprot:5425426-Amphidinium_carterae.1